MSTKKISLFSPIGIFGIVAFSAVLLFAGNVNAQPSGLDIGPGISVNAWCFDKIPLPTNSPGEWCRYARSAKACNGLVDIYESGDDCRLKIPSIEPGVSGQENHYYYSGNQFCTEITGGSSPSKTCVPRTDIVQPTPIPKLEPAPGFQPLLEKSKTQLEIERKNKQLEQESEQSKQNLTQKVQDQYQKDRAAGLIEGEETHYGTVQILRDGKITSLDSYIKANAGDMIRTGSDGFIEYASDNGRAKLGPDTLGVVLGLDTSNKKIITSVDWDKDPSYKPELNHWEFYKNTLADLTDFIDKNRPNYLKSCAESNIYECSWGTVEFIHNGVGWFNEKIDKDFKKSMVLTPTVAMIPVGTEFSVAVAPDGATTVTTLNGEVVVMDLTSRKSVIVGMNEILAVPSTSKGLTTKELQQSLVTIDPNVIDKWWEKPTPFALGLTENQMIQWGIIFWVVGMIIILYVKRKQIWPKRYNKIITK